MSWNWPPSRASLDLPPAPRLKQNKRTPRKQNKKAQPPPVRKHGADDEEAEGERLQDVHAARHGLVVARGQPGHEGAIQGQGHEGRAADGESLADRGGGVSRGVKSVGLLAHLCRLRNQNRSDNVEWINPLKTGGGYTFEKYTKENTPYIAMTSKISSQLIFASFVSSEKSESLYQVRTRFLWITRRDRNLDETPLMKF